MFQVHEEWLDVSPASHLEHDPRMRLLKRVEIGLSSHVPPWHYVPLQYAMTIWFPSTTYVSYFRISGYITWRTDHVPKTSLSFRVAWQIGRSRELPSESENSL